MEAHERTCVQRSSVSRCHPSSSGLEQKKKCLEHPASWKRMKWNKGPRVDIRFLFTGIPTDRHICLIFCFTRGSGGLLGGARLKGFRVHRLTPDRQFLVWSYLQRMGRVGKKKRIACLWHKCRHCVKFSPKWRGGQNPSRSIKIRRQPKW